MKVAKNKSKIKENNLFNKFIKGKELNPNNGDLFEELLKKAATTPIKKEPKPRGSK